MSHTFEETTSCSLYFHVAMVSHCHVGWSHKIRESILLHLFIAFELISLYHFPQFSWHSPKIMTSDSFYPQSHSTSFCSQYPWLFLLFIALVILFLLVIVLPSTCACQTFIQKNFTVFLCPFHMYSKLILCSKAPIFLLTVSSI